MITFTSVQEQVYFAQRALNESLRLKLKTDGIMGVSTSLALRSYQETHGLEMTGELDEPTWNYLGEFAGIRFLSRKAIFSSALSIGVDPSIVMAIREVIGKPEGFLSDGRPLVTFEHHKFYQYVSQRLGESTAMQWAQKYPNLCSPYWTQTVYKNPEGEWDRFDQARMLDATCAMLSSSWGMFEIMGFNYALAGLDSVQDFVSEMNYSEILQHSALLTFIRNQPLFLAALETHDYSRIDRMFNSKHAYAMDYRTKLEAADRAYARFN